MHAFSSSLMDMLNVVCKWHIPHIAGEGRGKKWEENHQQIKRERERERKGRTGMEWWMEESSLVVQYNTCDKTPFGDGEGCTFYAYPTNTHTHTHTHRTG